MVNRALVGRMIDDLGVAGALDAYFNYGANLDDDIEDFLKAKSAEWVLRASGRTRLRRAADAHHDAASLLKHLLTTEKPRLTAGRRRLLRAYLLFVGSEFGLDGVADALVREAGASRSVLAWYWANGAPGADGEDYICRLGGKYWYCCPEAGYCSGPHASLKVALADAQFMLNDSTQSVYLPGKSAAQAARLLPVNAEIISPGHVVRLNGEPWIVGDDLNLEPQAPATKPPAASGKGSRRRRQPQPSATPVATIASE